MIDLADFSRRWDALVASSPVLRSAAARLGSQTWTRLPEHLRTEALASMGIEPVYHAGAGLIIGYREISHA